MKLDKFILLLVFCSFKLLCFCQKQVPDKTFAVLFSPALLRAPEIRRGLQAGIAYNQKKWSVGAEAALPFRKLYDDYASIKYIRLGLELKKYVIKDLPEKMYLSFQTNYAIRQMVDTNGNTFLRKNPQGIFSFSKASVSSPVFSSAIKVGMEIRLSKNFFWDVFSGLGMRIISTSYKNVENAAPSFFHEAKDWFNFTPIYRYEGTSARLHLTTGIRLGYLISKK